ncbi:MAG TPA: sulfite exporter TauE/SafE family protein [Candidatus Solibacter sp.]|nr:sulfite exporter TauE/SafE family protein [Candidatus Solibacter sp.]
MSGADFAAAVFVIAAGAGFLGALTGLGGGVILTPVLHLLFHVDLRHAIGATLISVIATSSGGASAYVTEGLSNIRIGMFLEIATASGAIGGALLAAFVPTGLLATLLGVVLLYSSYTSFVMPEDDAAPSQPDRLAARLRLRGAIAEGGATRAYAARRTPLGFAMMFGAGAISGLLGIGSGALKVIAMDRAMRIPFKVSTATSNFMIGVTAAASAGIYLRRGYIDPVLAAPVMLGVLAGAFAGARVLPGARTQSIRLLFAIVVAALALELLFRAIQGG